MSPHLQSLIQLLSKLPGLGPRSGRRVALHLVRHRKELMKPLAEAMINAAERIQSCTICGNLDAINPCGFCEDKNRDSTQLCVVENVADLWALERSATFRGRYHVLGGTLSAIDGVGPDDLHIPQLIERIEREEVKEVIMALNMTVEGQTTAHYLAERLVDSGVLLTALAHGVPLGGELDYLDEGTVARALIGRQNL
ncbi:recombination mediator RecR [Candidatus Nucleicultrix amoebiphila]|uniref:Recombination protein RecR n=1 Tax=Candidatus Nucleicultrix amoebiphila FS5 TaxID=1414854 RepID=A0A1W6N4A4_9PROT|nr:recombination mediator RecR [Candidatus Nucleicultrix amoebiphila]ARN84652.1 recombinase RecR [Candidatus Nucleicultrix amoebiphila FS5]